MGLWILNIKILEKEQLAKLKLPQTSDDPNFNRPRRVTEEAPWRTNSFQFETEQFTHCIQPTFRSAWGYLLFMSYLPSPFTSLHGQKWRSDFHPGSGWHRVALALQRQVHLTSSIDASEPLWEQSHLSSVGEWVLMHSGPPGTSWSPAYSISIILRRTLDSFSLTLHRSDSEFWNDKSGLR